MSTRNKWRRHGVWVLICALGIVYGAAVVAIGQQQYGLGLMMGSTYIYDLQGQALDLGAQDLQTTGSVSAGSPLATTGEHTVQRVQVKDLSNNDVEAGKIVFNVTSRTAGAVAGAYKFYKDVAGVSTEQTFGTGDVVGPASPTTNALAKFTGTAKNVDNGPVVGTMTDTKWCQYTTAGGLACDQNTPSGFTAASTAEINAGTENAKGVTPLGIKTANLGTKHVQLIVDPYSAAVNVADASEPYVVPAELDGWTLVSVGARVSTVSTSGTPTFKIEKFHLSAAGTEDGAVQMLSTNLTVDANEFDSKDAATAAVISAVAGAATVATGDRIQASCVTAAGTGTKGANIRLGFQLP